MKLASGLQASATPQQPVGFQQGMQAPFMSAPSVPGSSSALATLQAAHEMQGASPAGSPSQGARGGAQLKRGGNGPQVDEQMPLTASDMAQSSSVAAPEFREPPDAPGIVPASKEETGAADLQMLSEGAGMVALPPASISAPQHPGHIAGLADDAAQDAEGSHPAGQAGQPNESADEAPGMAAQAEDPGAALRETGSQSNLAARVSASILTSNAPPTPPAQQAAAPDCHADDSRHQDSAEASRHVESGLVGSGTRSASGNGSAQNDISRPVGQAEASKLIGIRDDLDQLGPAQPDVPCCGRKGSHVAHSAGAVEEAHPEQASLEGGTDPSSMCAQMPKHSSEAIFADSSAVASEPVAGHLNSGPDQNTEAAQPPAPTGASQGSAAADYPPESLPQPVSIAEPLECGHIQQAIAPHLFDPTALLAKAQTPALTGLSERSSPPRNIDIRAGKAPG